ncbi:MAG: ferrous iron transport protein A [Mycobacteriaceae bacterium]|nr:ferrous iron transport protein A [Mycobacteriaceae bacterium]
MRWRRRNSPKQSVAGQSGPATPLAELAPGQQATILGVARHATATVANRLRQLGFRSAATITVIRRAPLGDPTIYRVQDTELCLRRTEAQLIEVVPLAIR